MTGNPSVQNFQPYIEPVFQNPLAFQAPPVVPNTPIPMVAIFSHLAFPTALHDHPMNYAQRITLYDGEGNFIAIQHVDRFDEFIYLQEVDYEYVKMRLFA